MSVTHGAKVDVLDQIAEQLGTDSQTVEEIRQSAHQAASALKAAWVGAGHGRLRRGVGHQ